MFIIIFISKNPKYVCFQVENHRTAKFGNADVTEMEITLVRGYYNIRREILNYVRANRLSSSSL